MDHESVGSRGLINTRQVDVFDLDGSPSRLNELYKRTAQFSSHKLPSLNKFAKMLKGFKRQPFGKISLLFFGMSLLFFGRSRIFSTLMSDLFTESQKWYNLTWQYFVQ
jgi:hypothetical protein